MNAQEFDNARHRARRAGLRLCHRGDVFTLYDPAGNTMATGSLSTVEAHIPDRRCVTPAPGTWAALISDYMLRLVAAGQPATTRRVRSVQLTAMARDVGARPADLTADQLEAWFGGHPEWSIETRRSYRAAVRGFLQWCYKTGRISEELSDVLPKVRTAYPMPRPAPDKVWEMALQAASPRTTLMLRIAAEAGLRRGEVARIHAQDVLDGAHGAQLLVHGKGGKRRIVPLSNELAEAIRQRADGGYLFPGSEDGHLSPETVGLLVIEVLPEGWTMHALRHRFATRAYRGTRNLRAVQMLLGHASVATTQRYLAVDDDELRAAMMGAAWSPPT